MSRFPHHHRNFLSRSLSSGQCHFVSPSSTITKHYLYSKNIASDANGLMVWQQKRRPYSTDGDHIKAPNNLHIDWNAGDASSSQQRGRPRGSAANPRRRNSSNRPSYNRKSTHGGKTSRHASSRSHHQQYQQQDHSLSQQELSNRRQFKRMPISQDWIEYVLQFGPCKEKLRSSQGGYYRSMLPYRADDPNNENVQLPPHLPDDHHLHQFYSSNHEIYYNPKTGNRNDRRHVALSIRAKEKRFYSMQDVDPLVLHAFTKVPIKKIAHAQKVEEIPQGVPVGRSKTEESVDSSEKAKSADSTSQPDSNQPVVNPEGAPVLPNECIFCGRSNVGKSSIINAIVKKPLMLTSIKPGKTQSLHFYRIGRVLTLVDLPGYGFAYDVDENLVQSWTETIDWYITNRGDTLKMVYLLVDCRHGFKVNDLAMVRNLETNNIPYTVIFTKTDLEFPDDIAKRLYLACKEVQDIKKELSREDSTTDSAKPVPSLEEIRNKFIMVSSISQSGVGKLRASMAPYMYLKKIRRRQFKENRSEPAFLTDKAAEKSTLKEQTV